MSASAQAQCTIEIVPEDAGEAWREAAQQALEQAESLPSPQHDCRDLVVRVQPGGGGEVALSTLDGRNAVRPVAGPEEVVPVVLALLVTLPQSPAAAADKTPPAAPPPPAPASDAASSDALGSGLSRPRLIVVAAGGAHTRFSTLLLSPEARVSAGALLGRFELGVFGAREFNYTASTGTSPAGFGLSATSVGLFGGLRQPIGTFGLIAGLELAASFMSEQVRGESTPQPDMQGMGTGESMDMTVTVPGAIVSYGVKEGRVAAYLAVVFPLRFRFRLRPQLSIEAVPLRVRDALPAGTTPPSVPRWGGTLMLAVEGTVL